MTVIHVWIVTEHTNFIMISGFNRQLAIVPFVYEYFEKSTLCLT